MASSSVGVYLGMETADLVCLSGSFQRPKVTHFGQVSLPVQSLWRSQTQGAEEAGLSQEHLPNDFAKPQAGMTQSLRLLMEKTGIPSLPAYTAVAPEAVVIRYFQMPTLPARERKLAVSFEAKKYVPFKLGEMVTDFQVVLHRADPTLMRVMFFGMKKASVSAILSLSESAGLSSLSIEPAPISLMRLLRQSGQLSPGQVAAILSLERETATISIAREDLLYLSRNITVAPFSSSGTGSHPDPMGALVNETRVSIDYYRRRFLGEPAVGKVILFGQGLSPDRMEELKSTLGLPVEKGDTFERIIDGKGMPATLAVATGVALRGLEKKTGQTNLLPTEQRHEFQGLLKPMAAEASAALAVLALWFGLSFTDLHRLQKQIVDLGRSQVYSRGLSSSVTLQELQRLHETQESQLQFLRRLSKSPGNTTRLLQRLAQLLPDGTWLQYVALTEESRKEEGASGPAGPGRILKLSGVSYMGDAGRELEGINDYLAALKQDELFRSAFKEFQLDLVQRGRFREEEVTEFRLTCASSAQGARRALEVAVP